MTAVQTLRDTKTERLTDGFVPQNRIEINESEETSPDWQECWCRDCYYDPDCCVRPDCHLLIEGQKQQGVPDEEILTMAQVVAICKEVRAEIYAEEQALANSR